MAGDTLHPTSQSEGGDAAHTGNVSLLAETATQWGVAEQQVADTLLDDEALVERAKSVPEAFGALYERYVRAVYGFAFSKLRDTALAEDITSQTFLQALKALPRYQQRGVPIRSWLFRITANLIADRFRRPIAEQPLAAAHGWSENAESDEQVEIADPKAEADITAWEQAQDFSALIAELTPEQRTVMRLRFAEGLPIAEIAQQMARSEGAVKMLMLRGLQNLRRRLNQEPGLEGGS